MAGEGLLIKKSDTIKIVSDFFTGIPVYRF